MAFTRKLSFGVLSQFEFHFFHKGLRALRILSSNGSTGKTGHEFHFVFNRPGVAGAVLQTPS